MNLPRSLIRPLRAAALFGATAALAVSLAAPAFARGEDSAMEDIRSPDPKVREEAVRDLAKESSVSALLALIDTLKDGDSGVQRAAKRALEDILDARTDDLDNFNTERRGQAIQILGAAAAGLANTVQYAESDARGAAAKLLESLSGDLEKPLLKLEPETRSGAAEVWSEVARTVSNTLQFGEFKAQNEAEGVLSELVKTLDRALVDPDPGTRQTASGLAKKLAEQLREALRAASSRGEKVAKTVLGRLTSTATAGLRDSDAEIRAQAARTLGEVGEPSAVDSLIEALADEEAAVRKEAAAALASVTGQKFGEDAQKWQEWWGEHRP